MKNKQTKIRRDHTGKIFPGRIVLGLASSDRWPSGKLYRTRWKFRCNCGYEGECLAQSFAQLHCIWCAHKGARPYRRKRPFEAQYNTFIYRARYPVTITYEQFAELAQTKECHYCGANIVWQEYRHQKKTGGGGSNLDRIDNTGGYSLDNVVVCCGRCNYAKGAHFTYDEWQQIGKLIKSWGERVVLPITPLSTKWRALAVLEKELEK